MTHSAPHYRRGLPVLFQRLSGRGAGLRNWLRNWPKNGPWNWLFESPRAAVCCARFARFFSVLILLGVSAGSDACAAEGEAAGEFRVETVVFREGQAAPLSRTTTYFTEGVICDVTHQPKPEHANVLLIDRRGDSAAIMDGKRNVVCSVSREEILRTVAAINARVGFGADDKQPLVKFAATPDFDVTWNKSGNLLRMTGEPLQYEVRGRLVGKTANARAAGDYREFADWSAQANATREGGLPPTARLELNDELAVKSCLPNRVERTLSLVVGGKKIRATVYSTHEYHWRLTATDRAEIQKWKARAAEMNAVDLVTLRVNTQIATQKSPGKKLK